MRSKVLILKHTHSTDVDPWRISDFEMLSGAFSSFVLLKWVSAVRIKVTITIFFRSTNSSSSGNEWISCTARLLFIPLRSPSAANWDRRGADAVKQVSRPPADDDDALHSWECRIGCYSLRYLIQLAPSPEVQFLFPFSPSLRGAFEVLLFLVLLVGGLCNRTGVE